MWRDCIRCGKAFHPDRPGAKYCSQECSATEHLTEFVCHWCARTFVTYPSRRPKPLKFCCRACAFAYQRNRTPTTDTEPGKPLKHAKKGESVVVDFKKKEMRNE
jgi:hypothetical protein